MIKTSSIIIISMVLLLTFGCKKNTSQVTRNLETVDSLLENRQREEALAQLQAMEVAGMSQNEEAYYNLLLTDAQYKNYIEITSDSIINDVVAYFDKTGDKDKYLKALVSKGCVEEVLGCPDLAVECYHQAESMDAMTDTASIAYAKMRLGYLYQSQVVGSKTIALNKFQEAFPLFHSLGNKNYELLCLSEIGNIYRNIDEKHDSAVVYLQSAIKLAEELGKPDAQFGNLFALAEYYMIRGKDYNKSKEYALKAITPQDGRAFHPRAHYRLASSYIHLGKPDSALYYLKAAPPAKGASDSIVYYEVMSEIEHFKHNDWVSHYYMERAHSIADSVMIHSLNRQLLEVEKKYDLQQEELKNSQLQARLRGSWLVMAAITIAALLLLLGLLRYRSRLRIKEHEHEMMRADLDASLSGLQQMQTRLDNYKQELQARESIYHEQMKAQTALEQEQGRLTANIAKLEAKKRQSDELRSIISQQIESIHQLMTWSYQHDASTFTRKFREKMSITHGGTDTESYWTNLHALVNDLHDNILVKAQEKADGTLNESEMNMLALYCCGFSRTVIMVTMGYTHIGTVYNKKNQIAQKLGVADLDDFVFPEKKGQEKNC